MLKDKLELAILKAAAVLAIKDSQEKAIHIALMTLIDEKGYIDSVKVRFETTEPGNGYSYDIDNPKLDTLKEELLKKATLSCSEREQENRTIEDCLLDLAAIYPIGPKDAEIIIGLMGFPVYPEVLEILEEQLAA